MKRKNYELPAIVWLKMTDYMHGWMQYELGCAMSIRDQKVVSVQDLPGARDVLMMESLEDLELGPMKVENAMSGNRRNMLAAGLDIDEGFIEKEYGLTKEMLKLFVPIECPKRCLTRFGVIRPWTLDVSLSKPQAKEMQNVIRTAFWEAVEEFDGMYARKMEGRKYPAVEMIEAFCARTRTPDVYVQAIRREWQRRQKRSSSHVAAAELDSQDQ